MPFGTGAISCVDAVTGVSTLAEIRNLVAAPSLGERNGISVADIEFDVTSVPGDADGSDFMIETS